MDHEIELKFVIAEAYPSDAVAVRVCGAKCGSPRYHSGGLRSSRCGTSTPANLSRAPNVPPGRCLYYFDSRVSPSGNLSSPGWPTQYPAGLRCTYVFQGEMFQAVQITFHSFELQKPYKAGCLSDYLDITTVDVTGVKEFVGRYCGSEVINPLLTLHPRLELLFVSNLAVQARGFTASFTYMHEGESLCMSKCMHECTAVLLGTEAVRPPETVVAGRAVCGGLVEGSGGRLASPGYPASFPGGLSCTWLLRARPHFHVYLRIQELQLQGSIANCRRAELAIYDGYRPVGHVREAMKVFCGDLHYYRNQADKEVLSERNRLLITFRQLQQARGLHLPEIRVLRRRGEGRWLPDDGQPVHPPRPGVRRPAQLLRWRRRRRAECFSNEI
ncbi:tolloid-like protein 1 [Penaeus indicus]|uniref:tolloid-like protein 1 n=1 Tax=Penaeus indicus TaxID=29960 RepID=UPI00300CFE62